MISEEVLERLSERLVNRIESLNTFMIKKLGEQLYDIGTLTPSQLREVMQSVKYGNNLNEIINKIAEITDKNVNDIYKIFEEVAKMNQNYAKQFYEYKKIKFIPYEQNKELQEQVKAIAKVTANEYVNISKTMAYMQYNELGVKEFTPISKIYQEITDKSILSIAQGRESYNMVMKQTMKELTSKGLRTVDYASGYSRRADTSVRMNIMDGVRTLSMKLQEQFGEEFGADGVEVSHHKNPAPDHEDTVDGKQFSKEEFKKINEKLKRHVGELNCYHFTYQIILGISKPLYLEKELAEDKETNQKGFEFEGKHYTNYEGTQLQRRIETKIREYKDRQIGAKAINDMDEVYHCQEKITQLTQKYKELSDVSSLPTKVERMRVEGYRSINDNTRSLFENRLIGIKIDDYTIKGISKHLLDRKTSRNVKVSDVENAFTSPLKVDKLKVDEQGRKSIKYIGEFATVAINPDTGTIITVWKTSSRRVDKLKGDK